MDLERLLREGMAHHQAGRGREAEAHYRRVLQHDPDHPDALHLLGVVAHQAGRRDGALGYLARAAALRPTAAAWQHNLGEAWLAINELDQAIAAYRKSVAIDPAKPQTRASLAIALMRRGLYDESAEQFEQAFAAGFDHPDVRLHHAKLLIARNDAARGDLEKAADTCRRSINARPNEPEAWQTLGEALGRAGKLDESVEAFRKALEHKPDFERPHHGLGVALAQQGNIDESIANFEAALRLRPEYPEAHQGLGAIYHRTGNFEKAAAHYVSAIAQRPTFLEARFEYAALLEKKGETKEAIEQYRVIQKYRPDLEDLGFHIAALEGRTIPGQAPSSYLVGYFDKYASSFDQHLTQTLNYKGPQLLLDAVNALNLPTSLDVLDLGCGTGLVGQAFKPLARRLVGIDISPAMLQRARQRGIFDELIQDDLAAGLRKLSGDGRAPPAFDLAVSADVFIYFGHLAPVFALISKALRPRGHLAFVTESAETDDSPWTGPDTRLMTTRRFAHSLPYLKRLCAENGLQVLSAKRTSARQEKEQPVSFWLVVARKA
jgi:predicted TPR repeat methyltransferase